MMEFIAKNRGKILLAGAAVAYGVFGVITGDMDLATAASKVAALVGALGLF
ncbi:MAG: hypothetical protein ACJ8AD_14830 [Gemmatimonadaceae bacterium]